MGPKVSVIVPVYKVESYLDDTVTCLLGQTYTNLEIILVDDGSPDRCGAMCDAYAAKDTRVKVIHKENGGLSSARNAGTKICTGDYIMFIDSDDVVALDYIEFLLGLCTKEKADIAVCLTRDFKDGTVPLYNIGLDYPMVQMNGIESLKKLFYFNEIRTGVISKLFSRVLLPHLFFQEGIYYEDAWPMYQAHLNARTVALGRAYKFGYRHRNGSQSRQKFSLKDMACVTEWEKIYNDVLVTYPDLRIPAACRSFSAYAHIFFKIPSQGFDKEKQYCWNLLKEIRKTVLIDSEARKKARYCAALSLLGKSATSWIGKKVIYEGL